MLTNIFDSHCHYEDEAFDEDRDELLSTGLKEGGVVAVIHAGANLERSQMGVDMAEKYNFMYAAVGVHPQDVDGLPDNYLDILREMTKSEKVVAIGEIGLDYHYDEYDREKQLRVFEEQLILAQELDLPVSIHSRDAMGDTMELLRRYKPKGVMHCFSGSPEIARELQELGMYVSFTGVLTFKNAKRAVESMLAVADDRLLLETDCPYMAPEPNRGKRCDSRMICHVAEKIAELRNMDAQAVIDMANANTCRLFGITL